MDHLEGKLCIDYEKGEYSRDKHKSETMVESDFRVLNLIRKQWAPYAKFEIQGAGVT